MTIDSWRAVFLAIPLILVMAMGQMMVIICRHVDISIGSILAFSAIVIGLLIYSISWVITLVIIINYSICWFSYGINKWFYSY